MEPPRLSTATKRLLLINPNTSTAMTERLRAHLAPSLPAGATLELATAPFGARYIADEVSYAVAGHAALVAYAAHAAAHGAPDAVLLGCFGDPGVDALRELSRRPVVGLAEAAMREAAGHAAATGGPGGRFAIVTGGAAWAPMLQRLARALGLADALAGVHVVAETGAQLSANPALAQRVLGQACRQAARGAGVRSVILGGAGLAGMAAALGPALGLGLPLIDSVDAGLRATLGPHTTSMPVTRLATPAADWSGLAAPLMQHLRDIDGR